MNEMIEFLSSYFIMDRRKTRIYFVTVFHTPEGEDVEYDLITKVKNFILLFEEQIQLAMDNGNDIMDEIRKYDPENKYGYNNLIV